MKKSLLCCCFVLLSCVSNIKNVTQKQSYFDEISNSISVVVDKLTPSLVYLEIIVKGRNNKENTIYANGCLIDGKGHMLTIPLIENRVISINAWYKTKKYEAYLIKNYQNLGYSVVRFIPPSKTVPIVFGDTSLLERGFFIYGIGATGENLSFEPIANFGMISAIISQRTDVIIHNGFPLYSRKGLSTLGMPITNKKGEVIGFTSHNLIVTSDDAEIVKKKFFERDKEEDDSKRPWIGIVLETISEDESEALNIPHSALRVTRVYYDSPAAEKGIKFNDVLIGINNQLFTKKGEGVFSQFRKWNNSKVNQIAKFHFLRQGKKSAIEINYVEIPEANVTKMNELGFSIQDIRSLDYYDYNLSTKQGVLVNEIIAGGVASGSYFDEDALNKGDVIVELEDVPITSVEDFRNQLDKVRQSKKPLISLKTLNGHFSSYVIIKPKFQ